MAELVTTLDYIGGNLTYQGSATAGSAKSAAEWQIKKFFYDGSSNLIDVQYADGETFHNKVWNDRTTLSYS